MRNPFRRRPPDLAAATANVDADIRSFVVPDDPVERRRLMAIYQQDPTPLGGRRFWRLAAPEIRAAFWAARRRTQAEAEGTAP